MSKYKLICTNCQEEYMEETINFRCDSCNEPLELEEVREGSIKEGNPLRQGVLERYQDFFPYLEIDKDLSLQEGFTPLISSKALGEEYGIKLYFKNETTNPTWSFKDRGTKTGIIRAMNLG